MQTRTIAVIGGTGKSGTYLVDQLLNRSYQVKLLARNVDRVKHTSPLLQLIGGDARNYEDIYRLVEGCGAIISTLGQPKNEPSIFSDASKNVVRSMQALDINRYIVTTGINVDAPGDEKDPKTKFATDWMHENFPEITQDKQAEHDFLTNSRVAWTLVRLPMIIQTEESFEIQVDLKNCDGDKISAYDLANFLIDQIEDQTYVGKSPFLSNI